jgi:SAM-dependent methyltransferase
MFTEQAVKPDSTVLDIGCGCGRTAQTLRDSHFRYAPFFKGRYVGVDIDAEAIDWCKRNFPADRFSFYCLNKYSSVYNPSGRSGTKLELPVESGSVDFVICGSLFTHLLEDECINYLEEIYRVLRVGGRAFTTFFCIDHLHSSRALGGHFTFNHRMGNAYVESLKYPEAAVAYEENYLLRTMREIGVSEVQVEAIQENHGSQSTFLLRR